MLGKTDELGPGNVDARSTRLPAPVLPAGTYLFRTVGGWDALVVRDGSRPAAPAVATDDADDGHILVQARGWFDHLWDGAEPIGPAPLFSVADHVRMEGSDLVGQVRSRKLVGDEWAYTVQLDGFPAWSTSRA